MKYLKKTLRILGLMDLYHLSIAWFSSVLYRHPSRKMTIVGITGTKGKSTTLELLNAILQKSGEKVVLASSIRFQVADRSWDNVTGNTMPGRGFLQKLMRMGVDEDCGYALLEVVSEGVVQHRHRFIDFDIAVFLGLHPEHIESHGSFEKYREAKLKFFHDVEKSSKEKKRFVINKKDPNSKFFIDAAGDGEIVLYEKYDGYIGLVGDFNKENAAAAIATARLLGVNEGVIEKALKEFGGTPGRMEFIQKEPFAVVVDYAHTPDSLEAVYKTLSSNKGGLICVLGAAGGGRDKWKRPKFGEIASKYCREIILTDEDPFDENPSKILSEIERGIYENYKDVTKNLDRKEAIYRAIGSAGPGDTVIITGKGSESYIRVANKKRIPWSDRDVARGALANRK